MYPFKSIPLCFLLVLLGLSMSSCLNQQIRKNQRATEKLQARNLAQHGNSFYAASTYATFSTVWFYHDGQIHIQRLANGKVTAHEAKALPDGFELVWFDPGTQADGCMELDGDVIGMSLQLEDSLVQYDYPVDIHCFAQQAFSSEFLQGLSEHIGRYTLWTVGN